MKFIKYWSLPVVVLLFGLWVQLMAQSSLRQEDLRVLQDPSLAKENQEMLFNYLLGQAEQANQKRLARLGSIHSEADFKDWQETNRRKFLELIGGLPHERTPLNPRVVGEFSREGYLVRKVIFESLPGFYVTTNLYIPTMGKPPYPAVLSPCGHTDNGKAFAEYQHLYIGLAKHGYVVLSYDPLGQAERYQYWDLITNRRRFEFNEHGMAGIQQYLLGQNLARNRIWDGLRALDYLTSLAEVDGSRLACTGNSGGGTLTTYLSMLDPRIKVASIITYITSMTKKIEARIKDAEADPEQDIQGQLAVGLDHTEFVGMIAPRPVLIGAAIRDFFPIEGTRKTFEELQQLYTTLGVSERVKMVEFDHGHMYSQPLREATYAWFDRWLKGTESVIREPQIQVEKDVTLQCTVTGQVLTSLGGKRIADLNRLEAEGLLAKMELRRQDPDFEGSLKAKIKERLGVPSVSIDVRARQVSETAVNGLVVEKLLLESEPGIVIPTRLVRNKSHPGRLPAVIYLRDQTGDQDSPELIENLAREGRILVVADVRGFGETKSLRNVSGLRVKYFNPRDGMDADFAYAALCLGRPLLGMRVWDTLQVVKYVRSRPEIDAKHMAIVGHGWSAVTALFSAALDEEIAQVAILEGLLSYVEVARSEVYAQPVSLFLPGVLHDFDLPEVLAQITPRPLLVLNPTDALTKKMDLDEARHWLSPLEQRYHAMNASTALAIRVETIESNAQQVLRRWLSHVN